MKSDRIEAIALGDLFEVECYDKHGNFKWMDVVKNLVVNTGLDNVLDEYFKGTSYDASHNCILMATTPTVAAADTMASHGGWTEVAAYDETIRPKITWGAVSSQSVNNTASKAVFTISTNATTVGGVGLVTGTGAATKSAATGTFYGGGVFTAGDKLLDDGDVLNVTVTATAAAS
jgi:hypothetical protein